MPLFQRRWCAGLIGLAVAAGAVLLPGGNRTIAETPSTAPAAPPAAAGDVTFARDIAPVLNANCVSCHHDGGGGPFPLTTYKDAAKHAELMAQVTVTHQMPPWKADAGYGRFQNERHLSAEQIDLFRRWADAGSPAGDLATAPPPPSFAHDSDWTLGKPDLVLTLPKAFAVPAGGRDVYRCFVLPLNLDADQFVRAVEYKPGNKTVVHHALFFLDRQGQARKMDEQYHADHPDDTQIGYPHFGGPGFLPSGGLGGWAPGALPSFLPDGVARPLAAGSDLVIQTHLHPSGKPETEQSTLGIYFAKKPPQHTLLALTVGSRKIDIPAGQKDYVVTDDWTIPADITLVGITPHAHLVCKTMDVWATLPDKQAEQAKVPLIRIGDWDFNWQGTYRYAEPMKLPAGTTLHMRYSYDNSEGNVRNPNTPPQRVRHGEQTNDEMAFCFFEAYADTPMQGVGLRLSMLRHLQQNGMARRPPTG